MAENQFNIDNRWQQKKRDEILVPGYYEKHAFEGRYVLLDKGRFARLVQKRMAVDTIVQSRDGEVVAIEEKIVRWKGRQYSAFALETDSCTTPGYESDGWMHYARADYLLYCFEQEDKRSLLCYHLDFEKLKEWFWPIVETFPIFGPLEQLNGTKGRVVPIKDAMGAAGFGSAVLIKELATVDI